MFIRCAILGAAFRFRNSVRVVGVRFSQNVLPHYACAIDHYLLTSSKYEHGYETREEDGAGGGGGGGGGGG